MTKLEEVARAICASDFDDDEAVYDTMSPEQMDNFLRNARAALTALWPPTIEMLKAGVAAHESVSQMILSANFADTENCIFRSMIDAALNEGKAEE